ncbi:AAA family ATPase [Mycoplasmopsis agalactiae]|uniref:AAA family ATPase n=1 Tax=Mycoplasmopsis agalactiae TaxID=2110 RepID=UPI0001CCBF5F|nr:AAA family ATPase [Mycoplasmopsis agalactiae]CBH40447.1 Pseudogene of Exodeoxyribonuclease V alphachain(RecD) (N terminal part) [Mycoplasmopsis agalactiae]
MKSFIGYIKEFTYNTDKDWAVANFYVLDTEKIIKISGNINSLPIEVLYEIQTDENPEEKYNSEIYSCKSYKLFTASDNQIFFEYLKSDVFNKTIGDDFIKKLESYYQSDNIWQEILSNKEKFLSMKQVRKPVLNSVFNKLTFSNLKLEFLAKDLDLNVLDKLIELYAGSFDLMQEAIKNSLYEINFQYKIASLESIDKIFLYFFKNDRNNVARIAHYLHNYCNEILNNKSSSYTYLENIKRYFDDQEKFFIPVELKKKVINNAIRYAKNKKLLIIKKDRIYTAQTYNDEMTIASFLTNKNKVKKIRHSKFKQHIKEIQEETRKEPKNDNFKYDESQINALRKFIDNKFVVITGGPGTGKTTLIKGIVKLFKKVYPNESFKIATPTGRAAARIKESFEESDATTIHKLLQYDPSTGEFRKNIFNPLDEGLLIIDETSMVDNNLFSIFISSIGNAKRVVFVGDVEQLPSIGIGNAFEDIIKSKKITTVELKSAHRQGKQSKITDLAYMIRNNNFDITKL